MAKVTLTNVSKTYPCDKGKYVTAVRNINIEIADREFVVFVGPSGCGKSTLLRMIAGLEEISQGDILIGDRRVNDIPPKDRDIAMVFQNCALYPHLNVFDNMAFGLNLRNLPKMEIQKRVDAAASVLGLGQLLDRKPHALSGGQRQRVAVGRAMVRQPKVFLFDEPLCNLDTKMRAGMRTEIVKLHQSLRATMIYVTHDHAEAMTMGSRIAVMDAVTNPETGLKEGVIQQIDSPLKLYNEPANMFVAGFLGSPPMNFLKGILKRDGENMIFKEAQGGVVELDLGTIPATATAYGGREVILGLRPESCTFVPSGKGASGKTFQAVAEAIEPLGAETCFHLQTGAHMIAGRSPVPLDPGESGHRVTFGIDAERTHLFDPSTGLRIH